MGILAFLLTFFIYLWGTYPTVTAQDAGELIVGPATLSIVHPPGYPLYAVVGHLWTLVLPLGSPAFRVNLFSAFLTASAVWGVFTLVRTWLPPVLGALAAIGIGVTPLIWDQALVAEVYPLHLALSSWLLVGLASYAGCGMSLKGLPINWNPCGVRDAELRNSPHLTWLVIFGWSIALANHQLMVLWGPVVVWLMIRSGWRTAWLGSLLAGLGLSIYLFLLIRSLAHPPMDWGSPNTWTGLWGHVMRRQYGALTVARHSWTALGHQFSFAWGVLWDSWWWMLPASGMGWVWLVRSGRRFGIMLLGLCLLSSLGVVLLANVRAVPMQEHQVRAFFSSPILMVGLSLAGAVQWFIRSVEFGMRKNASPGNAKRKLLGQWLIAGVMGAGVIMSVGCGWAGHRHERDTIVWSYAHDLLACLPQGSVSVMTGDFPTFPTGYAVHAEGAGAGLRIGDEAGSVFPSLLLSPEWVAMAGGPVYVAMGNAVLFDTRFYFAPEGLMYRVVSREAPPEAKRPRADRTLWRRLSLGAPLTDFPQGSFPRYLRRQYYAFSLAEWAWGGEDPTWAWTQYEKIIKDPMAGETLLQTMGTLLEGRGALPRAEACFEAAARKAEWSAQPLLSLARIATAQKAWDRAEGSLVRALAREPESPGVHFQWGNFLVKRQRAKEAIPAYQKALALDPNFVGAHKNLGAAYLDDGQVDRALAATQAALRLQPDDYQLHANIGQMYLLLGDRRKALEAWDTALRLHPQDQRLKELAAQLRNAPSP